LPAWIAEVGASALNAAVMLCLEPVVALPDGKKVKFAQSNQQFGGKVHTFAT